MANLKEIRSRIVSVNSTMQITSAMKLVSAAKLRRAQDAILRMRPYANKLNEILRNLTSAEGTDTVYAEEREVKRLLIVGITSNRGLCGAFNNNVIKRVRTIIDANPDKQITLLPIGKKLADSFANRPELKPGVGLPKNASAIFDELNFDNAATIAQAIMDKFEQGHVDRVVIVYNAFRNAAVQDLHVEQMLPVVPLEEEEEEASHKISDYIYEPNKEEILSEVIPKSLKIQLYKAILDSNAAEHGARMTAMHQATDNATELLRELRLTYNKARQAAITNEILEIVGGAEALKG